MKTNISLRWIRSLIEKSMKTNREIMQSRRITQRIGTLSKLFEKRTYRATDDLFFSIEQLPPLGKEYWFLHFCVPGKDEQVILTAGRASDPVTVNMTSLEGEEKEETKGKITCAAVCWFYANGKKEVLFDSSCAVSVESRNTINRLTARKKSVEFRVGGLHPYYGIDLVRGGKEVFSVRSYPPQIGLPYELIYLLKNPFVPRFGAAMVNYYYDFDGILSEKQVSGKAYLQKVVATLPLAPWNWARIYFENGAVFDYFAAKPVRRLPLGMFETDNRIEIDGKRIRLPGLKLEHWLEGEKRHYLIKNESMMMTMETYAVQPFVMKKHTTFHYDEYLVRVTDFAWKTSKGAYTREDMGKGSGIVEDAYGYLL